MKNSRKCPKCQSNEIYSNENNLIKTGSSAVAIGNWARFYVAEYLCTNCGYLERYMAEKSFQNKGKMEKVKQKWSKV